MRRLKCVRPGGIFHFAGERFVVLEQRRSGTFVLLDRVLEDCTFHGGETVNDRGSYIGSILEKRIAEWLDGLRCTDRERDAILPFKVELSCVDQSKSYGTVLTEAAPLTYRQFEQYRELIPVVKGGWWLATPWGQRKKRHSLLDGIYDAWIAFDDGCCYGSRSIDPHGVRPAMLLDSALKVHVERKCRRTDRKAAPVPPVLKNFYITDERAYLRLLKILDEGKE